VACWPARRVTGAGRAPWPMALYAPGQLKLEYRRRRHPHGGAGLAARSGNCLSLVLMTAALAREMGLDVVFQSARWVETYSRSGNLTFYNGHVNLCWRGCAARLPRCAATHRRCRRAADRLPAARGAGRAAQRADQRAARAAMFMNTGRSKPCRPAAGHPYAWVRESLRQDPASGRPTTTLGVVYQRAGHLAQAAAALEHALAHDPSAVPAMANQAQVLRSLGRHDEAAVWNARRAALEPNAPVPLPAAGRGGAGTGRSGPGRGLARPRAGVTAGTMTCTSCARGCTWRVASARGRRRRCARAAAASDSPGQQQAYAAKLERLRAAGTP